MSKTIHSEGHEALCAELQRLRIEQGLTQQGLADILKCHQSMVARIESGQRRIDAIELVVLARALNADIQKLAEFIDRSTPKAQRI